MGARRDIGITCTKYDYSTIDLHMWNDTALVALLIALRTFQTMNCYDIERKDRCVLAYTVLHQGQPLNLINHFWDVFWLMFLSFSLLSCILIALLLEIIFDCMISLELILLYEVGNCCSMLTVSHAVNLIITHLSDNQRTHVYLVKQ